MVDDKDNDANDPWAGIDSGDTAEPQGDFSFSLEEHDGPSEPSADEGFPGVFEASGLGAAGDAAAEHVAGVFEAFAAESLREITGDGGEDLPSAAVEVPALDDVPSSSTHDGSGIGDLPGFGDADNADDAALVDEWLTDDQATASEAAAPLGVFPAEDLHDDEHGQDREGEESAAPSSAIQIGTGNSGVMSPSDVISIDEWSDAGSTSRTSLTSLLGAADSEGDLSSGDEPAVEAFGIAADDVDEPGDGGFGDGGFGEAGFGMDEAAAAVGGGFVAVGAEALGNAAASAPAAPRKKAKAAKSAKSSGGGIGQIIGIVLGGLMALPITYAILVWGFQKDPFKFTKMVPPEVAFLLPEKFQPGFVKPSPAGGPKLDQAASLDAIPAAPAEGVDAATATDGEPIAGDAAAVAADSVAEPAPPVAPAEQPATPAADLFTEEPPAAPEPAPPATPEPEPLDFSALEAAIAKADASFEEFSNEADPESAAGKKLLVGWYKNLAAVAEQMVLLESAAADSARPLEKTPEQLEGVIAKLVGSESVVGDLGRLSGMWLSSKKRPADGAVLVATFNGARQVGPYWSSSITVAGKEPKTVAIISRREPTASAGDEVLVTGMLFDGDVVWAADCRRLEKSATAEDLF